MAVVTNRLDVIIRQGSKFEQTFTAKNSDGTVKDLTGFTARMQVRSVVASTTILMEATTGNGRIAITAPLTGVVAVTVGADITAALNWTVAYYDLEVVAADPTNVSRIAEGYASLSKEVTR